MGVEFGLSHYRKTTDWEGVRNQNDENIRTWEKTSEKKLQKTA
jgi:hypothetical protein